MVLAAIFITMTEQFDDTLWGFGSDRENFAVPLRDGLEPALSLSEGWRVSFQLRNSYTNRER